MAMLWSLGSLMKSMLVNWLYAYVGNDPINITDPTGRDGDDGDTTPTVARKRVKDMTIVIFDLRAFVAICRNDSRKLSTDGGVKGP